MKNLILLPCFLFSIGCIASKTDSLFQRHQFSFAMANGISVAPVADELNLFGTIDASGSNPYFPYNNGKVNDDMGVVSHNAIYLPNYCVHLKIEYSLGLSKFIRLETGAGYLMEGFTIKYSIPDYSDKSIACLYIGMLAIPLHIKFTKALHRGAFTCSFGPNVTIPFHDIYRTTAVWEAGVKQPPESGHQHFYSFSQYSNLGFDFKLSYEERLSKRFTVNYGPVIYMTQIVWANYRKWRTDDKIPQLFLASYIGFDVAFNFGLKK